MQTIYLPETVSLSDASTEINLNGMPLISAIRTLLMYSKEFNLPIYFVHTVNGYDTSKPLDEIRDHKGDITGVMIQEETTFFDNTKTLTLLTNNNYYLRNNENYIVVSSFHYAGTDYYTTDETQLWLETQSFRLDCFHINLEELNDFKSRIKLATRGLTAEKVKRKPKLNSRQDERETVFKVWLATKAEMSITDESQYQECYEQINSPTQKELWAMLQEIESQLFSAGDSDFFKNQKIIKFKLGTGNNRNLQ